MKRPFNRKAAAATVALLGLPILLLMAIKILGSQAVAIFTLGILILVVAYLMIKLVYSFFDEVIFHG